MDYSPPEKLNMFFPKSVAKLNLYHEKQGNYEDVRILILHFQFSEFTHFSVTVFVLYLAGKPYGNEYMQSVCGRLIICHHICLCWTLLRAI